MKWLNSNSMITRPGTCTISIGNGCKYKRGIPGGKQPTALSVVGLTGSFESSTARGPKDGLVALNLCSARGVMGGSSLLKPQDKYRVVGEPLTFQTPERFGVSEDFAASAVCPNARDEKARVAARAGNNDPVRSRILIPRSHFQLFPIDRNLCDPHGIGAALGSIAGHGNFVARFQGCRLPTRPNQVVRTGQFALPAIRCTMIVLHIDTDDRVRIYELEICECSIDRNRGRGIVPGLAMMRPE